MNEFNQWNIGAYQADQIALQQRLNQLEQMRQYRPQTQNVNWIQVAGIEGARNQIVQPSNTAWMMDNNNPVFYVKSVDAMGSATMKAFRFTEIPLEVQTVGNSEYVTREEFNSLLERLGEQPKEGKENE